MIVQQSILPPPLAQDIWLVLHMIRSLMIMSSYISTLTMQYKVAAKEIKGIDLYIANIEYNIYVLHVLKLSWLPTCLEWVFVMQGCEHAIFNYSSGKNMCIRGRKSGYIPPKDYT